MKRYKVESPRLALALAGIAMTAVTLGVSVVGPATLATGSPAAPAFAASRTVPLARDEMPARRAARPRRQPNVLARAGGHPVADRAPPNVAPGVRPTASARIVHETIL